MFCETHKHSAAMSLDTRFFKLQPNRSEVKVLICSVLRKKDDGKMRYTR